MPWRGAEGVDITLLRVLICNELPIVREGLRSVLDAERDIAVVETTGSGVDALELVRTRPLDVLVTGTELQTVAGAELIRRIRRGGSDCAPGVVVFPMRYSEEVAADVLQAGATCVLAEGADHDEVVHAVRAAARGEIVLASEVTELLVGWFRAQDRMAGQPLTPTLAKLTERERQVLILMARGLSVDQLAADLFIGVSTVRTHLHRLRTKLALKDRAQLVSFAYRAGLMN